MKTRINVYDERSRQIVRNLLDKVTADGTVYVEFGKIEDNRSIAQNKTQFLWYKEAAEQDENNTAESHRAYCKLHFGVPILRSENEEFRSTYDKIIRPLSYEDKIELMSPPIDLPVTSLMTIAQFSRYLNEIWNHFTSIGIFLTDPDGVV